jgi:predicted metalloprotease with PDZ domain
VPALTALLLLVATAAPPAIELAVDLREAPRRRLHATLSIPVTPGPATLLYPKWIPGEHGPTGPLADLAGLRISAGGALVAWVRDAEDLFAFHVVVPTGATRLDVTLDAIEPAPSTGGFSGGASETPQLALLSWNHVLLYPKGADPRTLRVRAAATLPAGWNLGTALPVAKREGAVVSFEPVSLETLVDSPVLAGRHLSRTTLGGPGEPPHALVIAADSAEATVVPPEFKAQLDRLVAESGALFGARHYRGYTFLLTLSDFVASFGLEHHESSDDRMGERAVLDPVIRPLVGELLSHEFVHSWNGKYRRPAGLATGDFQTPMRGDLLWIYEGLTQYLGQVLAARSGLLGEGAGGFREELALEAGEMTDHAGRTWRPLGDTATAASILYGSRLDGTAWRRGVDYYPEGALLWLEVDVLIRRQSNGARSIDDFTRAFFGGASGPPAVRPYTLDELLKALGEVSPRDWRAFFAERVDRVRAEPPLAGLEAGGWTLDFASEPGPLARGNAAANLSTNLNGSLGLSFNKENVILDVVPGSPADRAGVPAAAKLLGINGRAITKERLEDALVASAKGTPVELLLLDDDQFLTAKLDYQGGPRYPALRRDPARPDLLSAIAAPRVPPAAAAPAPGRP